MSEGSQQGKGGFLNRFLSGPAIAVLSVIWVWFGAQMGSGTACGNNQMNYFVSFGWFGLITVCIAMLIEMWMFYWGMELSRVTKQHHFSSWMREITYPLDKIFVPLFDVLCLIVMPVYTGSCLAGVAEVLSQYVGIPYYVGLGLGVILFILIAVFGMKLLAKVQLALSLSIAFIIIYTLIVGIPANLEGTLSNIANQVSGQTAFYQSAPIAIGYAVLFVAMQFSNLSSMPAAIKGRLRSKKDTLTVVIITGVLLTIVMFGVCFMLYGRFPGNLGVEIYTIEAVQAMDNQLIQVLYPVLLFCAFLSTGPVFVFSQTDRWSSMKFWENKLKPTNIFNRKPMLRRLLIGCLFVALSMYLSTYGFGFVTHYMFVFTSWAYLPFCFIPVVFLMPFRVRRMRKELAETGTVTTAASIRAAEAAAKAGNTVEAADAKEVQEAQDSEVVRAAEAAVKDGAGGTADGETSGKAQDFAKEEEKEKELIEV